MQDKPVALVTGANQGIGLQIAKDLTAHGFKVLVGSRNLERGQAAANEIGPAAHAIQLDVLREETIRTAAQRIRQEFGRLDVLINNAQGSPMPKHLAGRLQKCQEREEQVLRIWTRSAQSSIRTSLASLPSLRPCFRF